MEQVKLQMLENRDKGIDDIGVTFHCLLSPGLASLPDIEVYVVFGPPQGDWDALSARLMPSRDSPYANRKNLNLTYLRSASVNVQNHCIGKIVPYKYYLKSSKAQAFERVCQSQFADYNRCLTLTGSEDADVYDDLVCASFPKDIQVCARGRTDR